MTTITLPINNPFNFLLFQSFPLPIKNINNNIVNLYSNSIHPIKKKYDYESILNFTTSICNQFLFLQSHNLNIIGFNIDDILIIDDTYCIFIDPNKLYKTNTKIFLPPPNYFFRNFQNNILPFHVSNDDTNFIIGIFINFLFEKKITNVPSNKILNTKLYFFIVHAIKYNILLLI
uniref:Uncharacterized protein n=1 Tax=viral metagenome TaxID=1070528 RepID=A0A6C0H4T6_9ZZZZ